MSREPVLQLVSTIVRRAEGAVADMHIGFDAAGGMVYPSFGIVFGKAISSFALQDHHALRDASDRNALW